MSKVKTKIKKGKKRIITDIIYFPGITTIFPFQLFKDAQ